MRKDRIKEILRESVSSINEAENSDKYNKDYQQVQDKLNNTMLKANQVMAAAGLGDPNNASDRSLFSKKLRKAKNDDGGVYSFNEKDLASLIKVLSNPTSFLASKK